MRLLNVRLDPEDDRRAAELRQAGIRISDLVRQAIREAHGQRRVRRARRPRPREVMALIYAEYPDPPGPRPRRLDLTDRRAVRRAIARRLARRRS